MRVPGSNGPVFLALYFFMTATGGMLAGPTATLAQDRTAEARAAFGSGVQQYRSGKFEHALSYFTIAYELKPHPSVLVNIANCQRELDRPLEALESFERFLSDTSQARPAQVAEVETTVRTLRRRIAEIELDVAPEDASVTIDDEVVEDLTRPVRVLPGRHSIAIEREGFTPVRRRLRLRAGQSTTLSIQLEPVPYEREAVEEMESPLPEEDRVTESLAPHGQQPADSQSRPVLRSVWITGGVTAALAIGTLATGFAAVGANRNFDRAVERSNDPTLSASERSAWRAEGQSAADRTGALSITSDVLLAGTLVGAGLTAYFFFTRNTEEQGPVAHISPAVGPHTLGVQVGGSF